MNVLCILGHENCINHFDDKQVPFIKQKITEFCHILVSSLEEGDRRRLLQIRDCINSDGHIDMPKDMRSSLVSKLQQKDRVAMYLTYLSPYVARELGDILSRMPVHDAQADEGQHNASSLGDRKHASERAVSVLKFVSEGQRATVALLES